MFNNLFKWDTSTELIHDSLRKHEMMKLVYIISILVLTIFSVLNYFLFDKIYICLADIFFLVLNIYGYMKYRDNYTITSSVFTTILLFVSILSVIFVSKFHEYVVIWSLLFPFIAMDLNSMKNGLTFTIIFNICIYIGAYYFWRDDPILMLSYFRLVIISIVITILVYKYEFQINKFYCEQKKLNQSLLESIKEVRELAITDSLTNIYNKRHFDTVFNDEFNRAKRADEAFILAIIDIDNFKLYNDTYGHDSGNTALERVGKILKQQTLRSGDYAFRIGGEEFALILQSRSNENIDTYLNHLRQLVEDEKLEHSANIPYGVLTISIGAISILNYDSVSLMESYRKADKNLYAVKRNGRNGVIISSL